MNGSSWLDTYGFAVACLASVTAALGAGVADYTRFYQQRSTVIAAAWAGARSGAAVLPDDARPRVAREAALDALGGAFVADADVSASVWSDGSGRFVTVEVSVPYDEWMPLLPKPDALRAQSTWRLSEGLTLNL